MRITSRIERPTIGWDEQSGYFNGLVAGSPEHSGAHSRLLELAIEMESDFEPYGIRSRQGDHWQDFKFWMPPFWRPRWAAGSGLGRLHEQEFSKGGTADIRAPGISGV
jgi:hypothetical protein